MSLINATLGVMICRDSCLKESTLLEHMAAYAERLRLRMFVFTLHSISWKKRSVKAFKYNKATGVWDQETFSLPQLIYDRCFIANKRELEAYRHYLSTFSSLRIPVIGSSLKGKWDVQLALQHDVIIKKILPKTERLISIRQLHRWLTSKDHAFLKPEAGSMGKRTIQIAKLQNGAFYVNGRDAQNRSFQYSCPELLSLCSQLQPLIKQRKYLLQPDLKLVNKDGAAYDIRILVQKNNVGMWHRTGMAVREGQHGSATANLHGGGKAFEVLPYLTQQFGAEHASTLVSEIKQAARRIPALIEQSFGRFYELGIDLGIDHRGRMWLLEVNSKPGRSIFSQLGDRKKERQAISLPLLYANYFLRQRFSNNGHALLTFRRVT